MNPNNEERVVYNRLNEIEATTAAHVLVDKRFRFNLSAVAMMKLKTGKFLHLINYPVSGGWAFVINDDSAGLRLTREGDSITAHGSRLAELLIARNAKTLTALNLPLTKVCFPIDKGQKVGAEIEFRIDTTKPFKPRGRS